MQHKGQSSLEPTLPGSAGGAQRFKQLPSNASNVPINVRARGDLLSIASNFLISASNLAGSSLGNLVAFSQALANLFPDEPPGKPLIE